MQGTEGAGLGKNQAVKERGDESLTVGGGLAVGQESGCGQVGWQLPLRAG